MPNWPSPVIRSFRDATRNWRFLADWLDQGLQPQYFSEGAKEQFLQLVSSLLGAKVAFGTDAVEFPGGTRFSSNKSVTHGLKNDAGEDIAPTVAFAQLSQSGELDEVMWAHTYTETTFQVRATNAAGGTPGAGTKRTFAWIAIG